MERVAAGWPRSARRSKIVGTIGSDPARAGARHDQVRRRHAARPAVPAEGRRRRSSWPASTSQYPQLWSRSSLSSAVVALYVLFRFARAGAGHASGGRRPRPRSPCRPPARRGAPDGVDHRLDASPRCPVCCSLPFIGLDAITLTFLVVQAFGAAAIGVFSSIPLTFLGGLAHRRSAPTSRTSTCIDGQLARRAARRACRSSCCSSCCSSRRAGASCRRGRSCAAPPLHYRAPGAGAADRRGAGRRRARARPGARVGRQAAVLHRRPDADRSSCCRSACWCARPVRCRCATPASPRSAPWRSRSCTSTHGCAVAAGPARSAALVAVPVGALVADPGDPAVRPVPGAGHVRLRASSSSGCSTRRTSCSPRSPRAGAMPRPSLRQTDGAVLLSRAGVRRRRRLLAVVAIQRVRLGRILRGMSDSPVAVATMGLSTNVTRVIVFCISAFIAGVGRHPATASLGALRDRRATRSSSSFNSLILLAMLALAPFGEPWFALVRRRRARSSPAYIDGEHTTRLVERALRLLRHPQVAVQGGQPAMPPKLEAVVRAVRAAGTAIARPVARGRRRTAAPVGAGRDDATGLAVSDLVGPLRRPGRRRRRLPSRRRSGRITGLIGPNGAGKTTTFNACSGLNRPIGGDGPPPRRTTSRGCRPRARGRRGLGRTFQRMQLCDSLTVAENVALGREAGQAGAHVAVARWSPARRPGRATERPTWRRSSCAASPTSPTVQAGALSTGQRRLVELARCLAGTVRRAAARRAVLRSGPRRDRPLRRRAAHASSRERGCGILLVEHDMSLVMRVCDYIYVLDFGS